jgi:hypothetical protein
LRVGTCELWYRARLGCLGRDFVHVVTSGRGA